LTQVGLIGGLSMLTAFFIQPVFGYLADYYRRRTIALTGFLIISICIPLVGIATGYGFILALIGFGSIGSAMYHPSAAGMISPYSGRHTGLSISLFGLGGSLAVAIGPVVLTGYVTLFGLERLPYITLLGLLVFPILMALIPTSENSVIKEHTFFSTLRNNLGSVWKPIVLIWSLAFTRALLGQGTLTFIPMFFTSKGYSLVSIGIIISIFTVGGSISSLVCGYLVDRFGYRPIYYFSFALSTPSLYLFVHSTGWLTYVFSFISGFIILATMFPAVALAQKVAPKSRSLVSSIIMGLPMGLGGILMPFIGSLSDVFGIQSVLSGIALIPFGMLIFIRYLPDPR
jgi:FSR family fosmidomycin resistance protein-like MFS transporter